VTRALETTLSNASPADYARVKEFADFYRSEMDIRADDPGLLLQQGAYRHANLAVANVRASLTHGRFKIMTRARE